MKNESTSVNPRLNVLRREVEQTVLKPFQSHGWSANIVREVDHDSYIEISAAKEAVTTRIAVLYSSSEISNAKYRDLSARVDHIFFSGQPYMLDSFAKGVTAPVEPLGDFFPFLVNLNKQVEPARSAPVMPRKAVTVRRLTAEKPLEAVITRLQQFTSVKLAANLVERRAVTEGKPISREVTSSKATGIAYLMRSALDYLAPMSGDKLNRRVVSLYYGTMALAQAEMLAWPAGPVDLDQIEGMTRNGHGLYALPGPNGGFAELRVGVLATGFIPEWMSCLGHDTSGFPKKRPRSNGDIEKLAPEMVCSLRDLFASMPEIDDLFAEVFGGPPKWISVAYDSEANLRVPGLNATEKKVDSSYVHFIDRSGEVSVESLIGANWPLAEIHDVIDPEYPGIAFRARVDHPGHDYWWGPLPIHHSPFGTRGALLFPTVGGQQEYRTIAATTLYALYSDNQHENSCCLIQKCSRVRGPLPHQNVPFAILNHFSRSGDIGSLKTRYPRFRDRLLSRHFAQFAAQFAEHHRRRFLLPPDLHPTLHRAQESARVLPRMCRLKPLE